MDGVHVESIWNGWSPHGVYMEWMESTWSPCGVHVESIWNPSSFHVESMWTPCGMWGGSKDLPRIQKRLGFVHEMEGGREQAGPRLVPHRRMVPVCHVYLVFELWASLA